MGGISAPIADRLWRRVTVGREDECWLWNGATYHDGYGSITKDKKNWEPGTGRSLRTHRVAWEVTFGAIPEGLWVLHRCDTPLCCNPSHLFLGTHRENMKDAKAKGRMKGWHGDKTHCKHGHSFIPSNTRVVRRGTGWGRECKACRIETKRRWRERQRVSK